MRVSDPASPEITSEDTPKPAKQETSAGALNANIVDTTATLADPSLTDIEKLASLTIEFKRLTSQIEEITSFKFDSKEEEALALKNLSTGLDDFEDDRVEVADKSDPVKYVKTLEAYKNWAAKQITDNHHELEELRKTNAQCTERLASRD
jgi:hypothetical protein